MGPTNQIRRLPACRRNSTLASIAALESRRIIRSRMLRCQLFFFKTSQFFFRDFGACSPGVSRLASTALTWFSESLPRFFANRPLYSTYSFSRPKCSMASNLCAAEDLYSSISLVMRILPRGNRASKYLRSAGTKRPVRLPCQIHYLEILNSPRLRFNTANEGFSTQ